MDYSNYTVFELIKYKIEFSNDTIICISSMTENKIYVENISLSNEKGNN